MPPQDRTFALETEYGTYPAVITAGALRKLNAYVEMFTWGELTYRNRDRICEAALRKFEKSGLDARGRLVVGPEDLLSTSAIDETPVTRPRHDP